MIDAAVRASIGKLLDGVQVIGFDWTYLYLNDTAERHARRPAGDLIGRRMTDCFPGIDRTPMFEALKRVMAGRKAEQFLSEFVYPDGTQGWFELLIEPVADGLCVLSHDVADRQRVKSMLQRQLADAPVEAISLSRVLLGQHALLTRLAGDSVRILMDAPADTNPARLEPGDLEQVVMNLVANSRDAMPGGGTVRIATFNATLDAAFARSHPGSQAGSYAALLVEDSGAGMTAEVLANIFEPFFTTKPAGKGTGLGLPSVYATVKRSGGYITIDSRPGVGTTVTVYFPSVDGPLLASDTAAPPTVSGAETLLLVEEDDEMRDLMRRSLAPQGYTVLEAPDVWEALTIAGSRIGHIDLLATGIVMDGMNGPELAQHIIGMQPGVRVLYISGFAQAGALGALALNHHVSFLPRPFGPEALLASVRETLDRSVRSEVRT